MPSAKSPLSRNRREAGANIEVKEIVMTPAKIRVHGPVNHLNDIEKLTIPFQLKAAARASKLRPCLYRSPIQISNRLAL